jgi:hypothetical protein
VRATGLCLVALITVACTSSSPEPSDSAGPGNPTNEDSAASPPGPGPRSPTDGDRAPGGGGDDDGRRSQGQLDDPATRRTVTGSAPAYVEIESASLRDLGRKLEMNLSLDGPIPNRLPDDRSTLRVTFSLIAKPAQRYSLVAQAAETGWHAFMSGSKDSTFPGELRINSERLRMLVEWDRLGGRQPLKWNASLGWARGSNSAFDIVPESGYASFP